MTRIVLDLDALLADGKLSHEEAQRLRALALPAEAATVAALAPSDPPRRGVFANILMIFGALAAAIGIMLLNPTAEVGAGLGLASLTAGWFLARRSGASWRLLASALVIGGALGVSASVLARFLDQGVAMLAIGLFLGGVAIFFRNGVVAAFAPLALGSWLGSGSGYWHASYSITITQPLVTVLVFSTFSMILFWMRGKVAAVHDKVATVMARVSFFLANFGFWVGSLFGEDFRSEAVARTGVNAPDLAVPGYAFSLAWAVALLVALAIGLRTHRRFISNTAVTFLGIHFYTQVFETFGGHPLILIAAGLSIVALAFGLVRFDAWQRARPANP